MSTEHVNVDEVWESGYHAGYAAAKPRTIETAEELDSLPEGSIILTPSTNPNYPSVFRKVWRGEWLELDPGDKSDGEYGIGAAGLLRWDSKDHTATVLFDPKEETK